LQVEKELEDRMWQKVSTMQPEYWQFYTYARKVVKVIQIDNRVASMLVQKLPEL